jgi:hypothetical protein
MGVIENVVENMAVGVTAEQQKKAETFLQLFEKIAQFVKKSQEWEREISEIAAKVNANIPISRRSSVGCSRST